MIPVSEVRLGAEEEQLVLQVLRSGRLAQGPMVERFEAAFASLVGVRHAVAVGSGTAALVLALEAAGVGPGDEVVTSPFTFAATLNAALAVGATVRFADIGLDDFTLDPDAAAAQVGPRTAALLPVHLYGQPCDMAAVTRTAASADALVVEDAAQAHGAAVDGRPVGSFGVGCFSFYATKNVTTGEGGMVTTDDDALADRVRLLRNQGMRARYAYEMPGHNHRLTELQAAVGLPQLARLQASTERRQENACRLSEGLGDVEGLMTPTVRSGVTHVFHQYTVRVTAEARASRDDLVAALDRRGVGSGVYYPRPVFDYPCYRGHPGVRVDAVPNAERAGAEVLSLPVHPGIGPDEIDIVVEAVRDVLA